MNHLMKAIALAIGTLMATSAAQAQEDYATEAPVEGSSDELRAPSPRIMNPDRPGYFQIGAGPAFGIGLKSDGVLYNINAGYNYNFTERFTGKIIGDVNLGSGNDTSRYSTISVGGDFFLNEVRAMYGVPYVTADAGWGFVRNNNDVTQDAASIGVGTGFKFSAESLNVDINAHYSILTAQIEGVTPQVLGLRAALNF